MSLKEVLARALRFMRGTPGDSPLPPALDREKFVYVKLPENIGPLDRAAKYENSIDERLRAANLGEVSGGGSQLGEEKPDGSRDIEFCGIDIDVIEQEPALILLRESLSELGAPEGTELHYTRGTQKLQDVFVAGSWQQERARAFVHPGFGW